MNYQYVRQQLINDLIPYVRQQIYNNLIMERERELVYLDSQICKEGDVILRSDSVQHTLQELLDRIVRLEETVYEQSEQPPVLESLDEHNKRALGIWEPTELECKVKNGIACPNCGAELFDSNVFSALFSYPPQYRTHCESCDYQGTRY